MTDEATYGQQQKEIEQFLSLIGKYAFNVEQIDKQFNYASRLAKNNRWHVLKRLEDAGKLERVGSGKYRLPDTKVDKINWWDADVADVVKIAWPLNLQKYVKTYHRSINILAGCPGAGKTAFLYNFVLRNMGSKLPIALFSNDMTAEEMKERFVKSEIQVPNPPPFETFDRNDNFGDVVLPDAINVIDYLDLNSEVYLIGDEIEKIYRKLNRGIALIGIQKKPGQQLGLGGIFSEKRSKLYLSLDTTKETGQLLHKLTIEKVRGRANPEVNPIRMEFKFKLVNGIELVAV